MNASAVLLCALVLTGCSDKSGMKLYLKSIEGTEPGNAGKQYIEADLIGCSGKPCTVVQDQAKITVGLDRPGAIGPSFNAEINGYEVQYYYFDPADGQLKGPVSGLTVNSSNVRVTVPAGGTASFVAPVVSYVAKAWSTGVTCSGVPGFAGAGRVDRMILKITIRGSDYEGGALSAEGSISIFLYDYGPGPVQPTAGSPLTADNWCYGYTIRDYWIGCPGN